MLINFCEILNLALEKTDTCDALLKLVHQVQASLDVWPEPRLVSLDSPFAFDVVNHGAVFLKNLYVGINGSLYNTLSFFNRCQ